MTTIVASPPTFQSLPRVGWNGSNTTQGGFTAMSSEDVSRMFMPQRKVVTRSSSSSSLASNSSATSTATITSSPESIASTPSEPNSQTKKKQRGGFWPVSKAESTSSVTNARANGAVQPANPNGATSIGPKGGLQSAVAGPNEKVQNGQRAVNGNSMASQENSALLILLPVNGTFERKQIHVPFHPEVLKIGRQTNAKTVPTPTNGFFDSKVLSRQHAEIFAERNGNIMIRDVKSSNGTFINSQRLSPENRESEPHPLNPADVLELGIDIVSEDGKVVVHHKVSAKVEFAGLPTNTSNVLDLSFGDLDPSHGNNMLNSPMSAPMAHSRNLPNRPPSIRGSAPSSIAGSTANSMAQRQANYWGPTLNIEQLVKHLNTEMRAAKQQAMDLDQANNFLHAMLPESGGTKLNVPKESPQPAKQPNGRVKAPRVDNSARFADPPAPPPQQPLPEKPDSVKAGSPTATVATGALKRENTAKGSLQNANGSPTSTQSSQILTLLEQLNTARKEIESQGAKMKQLEDMLKQEKSAREAAEEKAKRLEETAAARPVTVIDTDESHSQQEEKTPSESEKSDSETASLLQQRLDEVLQQMQLLQTNLDQTTKRAEVAETESASLADMIQKYREEQERHEKDGHDAPIDISNSRSNSNLESDGGETSRNMHDNDKTVRHSNGHITPPKLPEHLERAMTTVLQQGSANGDMTAHSGPYLSMLGVVFLGVGIMAYLNQWQKADK